MIRLPGVCSVCRRAVMWTGRSWKDAHNLHRRHQCPQDRPVCGVWMRVARERCARKPGHAEGRWGGHRTAYALECERRAKRAAA